MRSMRTNGASKNRDSYNGMYTYGMYAYGMYTYGMYTDAKSINVTQPIWLSGCPT